MGFFSELRQYSTKKRLHLLTSSTRRNILLRRAGGIGDCLMCTPALRELRKKYPYAYIVMQTDFPDVFFNNPNVNKITTYLPKVQFFLEFGYENKDLNNRHVIDIMCDCVGVKPQSKKIDIYLTQQEEGYISAKFKSISAKKYVVLHPWVGYWNSNKNWYLDRWNDVVRELQKSFKDLFIIQIGKKNEPLIANVVDFREKVSLREAFVLVKHAQLLVAVNSCFEQVAQVFGTKYIILYGPTDPENFGYSDQINVFKKVGCNPCYPNRNRCTDRKCMLAISVDDVLKSAIKILNENSYYKKVDECHIYNKKDFSIR